LLTSSFAESDDPARRTVCASFDLHGILGAPPSRGMTKNR
jgi:hypothetical protein